MPPWPPWLQLLQWPPLPHLIDSLAARLTLGDVTPAPDARRRAAVAVVLHDQPSPRVLLMKRAERPGDPWSGHISLPGGRYQASDGDLRVTAIRESHEELGIDLTGAQLLGNLAALHPRSSGPDGIEPVCGPEALAAFWLPIDLAISGALDGTYHYAQLSGMSFPSWTYEGHVIWGLTRRILDVVLETAGLLGAGPDRAKPDEARPQGRVAADQRSKGWTEDND
jgi:8-oxo-dGTP pyrophosphatase MutT (NUDIX family)